MLWLTGDRVMMIVLCLMEIAVSWVKLLLLGQEKEG